MKSIFVALFLIVVPAFAPAASSTDISGHWTVQYAGGMAWKTIGRAEFDFQTEGPRLTGMANVGHGYPGEAPISNGKIEGDLISFTVYGKQPSSSGFPKMNFIGTVHGDVIRLTMTLYYGDQQYDEAATELEGQRGSKK